MRLNRKRLQGFHIESESSSSEDEESVARARGYSSTGLGPLESSESKSRRGSVLTEKIDELKQDATFDHGTEGREKLFSILWSKDKKRPCCVNIPDTILMKRGQLDCWLFTAKDGSIKKKRPDKLTLFTIMKYFTEVSRFKAKENPQMVAVNEKDRKMAILTKTNGRRVEMTRDNFQQWLFGVDKSNDAFIQVWIPPKGGWTKYVTSFDVQEDGRPLFQVKKRVCLGKPYDSVTQEDIAYVRHKPQYITCHDEDVNNFLHERTLTVVKYLRRQTKSKIHHAHLEFIVDANDRAWMIGGFMDTPTRDSPGGRESTKVSNKKGFGTDERKPQTDRLSLPKLVKHKGQTEPQKGPLKLAPRGKECPGSYCSMSQNGAILKDLIRRMEKCGILNRTTGKSNPSELAVRKALRAIFTDRRGRRKSSNTLDVSLKLSSLGLGDDIGDELPSYVISAKSLLLDQAEKLGHRGSELSMARDLFGSSFSHFYREVKVCKNCYRMYIRIDEFRKLINEASIQHRTAGGQGFLHRRLSLGGFFDLGNYSDESDGLEGATGGKEETETDIRADGSASSLYMSVPSSRPGESSGRRPSLSIMSGLEEEPSDTENEQTFTFTHTAEEL